ncbi:MAG: hypothetical protein H0U74_22970 [Bradymonadaceae bacterium]|nr:hypothetical protein [Lujinxingiaceae bacterium]
MKAPIAWLLLEGRHTVPISDLRAEGLKTAFKNAELYAGKTLSHLAGLRAIISRLGFEGDFGDYKHKGWRKMQGTLRDAGAEQLKDLFAGRGTHGPQRRHTAERLFESGRALPQRLFLVNQYQANSWSTVNDDESGWFDVVAITPNLVAIVGKDGSYDLLWRYLREQPFSKCASQGEQYFAEAGLDA